MKKSLLWFGCYFLIFTSPILLGYHLEVIRQAARGEDQVLPEFVELWAKWKTGFCWYIVFGFLCSLPMFITFGLFLGLASQTGDPSGIFPLLGTTMEIFAVAGFFFMPSSLLRYAMSGELRSALNLRSQCADIRQGFISYLGIAFGYPLLCFLAAVPLAITGFGILVWFAAMPLMAFGHARLIGNYYRHHFQA